MVFTVSKRGVQRVGVVRVRGIRAELRDGNRLQRLTIRRLDEEPAAADALYFQRDAQFVFRRNVFIQKRSVGRLRNLPQQGISDTAGDQR